VRALLALLVFLAACADDTRTHVRGSTVRLGPSKAAGADTKQTLQIYDSDDECGSDAIRDPDRHLCYPFIDRASGTVRLAIQLSIDGQVRPMALNEDSISVYHQGKDVDVPGETRIKLVPHDEEQTNNLYVLLMDGSGSMAVVDGADGLSRMDKLKKALLRRDVVDSFFPPGTASAVSPLVFRGGLPEPLGGKWVVEDAKEYRKLVKDQLQVGSGFTYLYQAVRFSMTSIAEQAEVRQAVENGRKAPTVIALTDGFNNERPQDLCGDNVPRLQELLTTLRDVRLGRGGVRGYQPDLFTVGLGRKAWRRFKVPEGIEVKPRNLCERWAEQVINGNVENMGVDNAALEWMAKVGGGKSYVKRDADGLAEAFIAAAQKRYAWYELRYRVDPFHLRRSFTVTVRINAPYQVESTVTVYPSAWLDGPPGTEGDDGWVLPGPFRATIAAVMPIFAALIVAAYLPAALFNVRRALFGLVGRA